MKTTALTPFGLLVEVEPGTAWNDLAHDQIKDWIAAHRVLVIRGLQAITKRTMPLAARRLRPLQAWSFGAVNVLEVDPDKDNFLFTEGEVPPHWDGAFKGEIPNSVIGAGRVRVSPLSGTAWSRAWCWTPRQPACPTTERATAAASSSSVRW